MSSSDEPGPLEPAKDEDPAQSRSPAHARLRNEIAAALSDDSRHTSQPSTSEAGELKRLRAELQLERQRYRELFDNAPLGYLIVDDAGTIERASATALELLQRAATAVIGRRLRTLCTADTEAQLEEHLQILESGARRAQCDVKISIPSRAPIYARLDTCRIGVAASERFRTALIDLTEQRAAESRLSLAASVVEHTSEGVMITDADRRIIAVNPAFSSITGYSASDVLGSPPRVLREQPDDSEHYRRIREQLARVGHWQGEIWNRRKNGQRYLEWLSINEVRDETGNLTHYVSIFSDVSHQHQIRKQLYDLAYYDSLTGLSNRQHFMEQLSNALFTAVRELSLVGLIYIDLDHFKDINDSLGHSAGDQLLCFVARLLQECVRKNDTVARLGGDEFTIILSPLTSNNDAATVANKILRAFQAIPFTYADHEYFLTASIGIALFPDDAQDSEGLLRSADMAMYRTKQSGRNGYTLYAAGMDSQHSDRLSLEADLRRALARNELSLAFQPKIRLTDGKIIGCETLVRWNCASRGPVSPVDFIPLAEESGLIVPLGHWVLNEALKQVHDWQSYIDDKFRVSVNISAAQLRAMHANRLLHRLRQAPRPDRHAMELELTESVLMREPEQVRKALERIKRLGIGIAIDDFGTSYSSANLLKQLPIDRIKIDLSFVRDLDDDQGNASIVSAILVMAQALSLTTVAEGVETPEQLAFLHKSGCNEAQGFLFSAPLSAMAMTEYLADGRSLLPEVERPIRSKQHRLPALLRVISDRWPRRTGATRKISKGKGAK